MKASLALTHKRNRHVLVNGLTRIVIAVFSEISAWLMSSTYANGSVLALVTIVHNACINNWLWPPRMYGDAAGRMAIVIASGPMAW
jgi:hypothetical protein